MRQGLNMPIVDITRGAGIEQTQAYAPAFSDAILDLDVCQIYQETRDKIRIGLEFTCSALQD